MKKAILLISLLALPFAFCNAQVSVSGVKGSDGYSVLRAQADLPLMLLPGLSLYGKYAAFSHDNFSTMSKYGAGAAFTLPFLDIVDLGVEAGLTPKANQYSAYYWDAHGSVNLANIFYHLLPADELRLTLGLLSTYHSFYQPDYKATEQDIYASVYQRVGGFDASVMYSKAVSLSGDGGGFPPWLDIPNFVSVYAGYLDYSLGASAGYTYKIVRPYAAYAYLKTKNSPSADDLRLGLIVSVGPVAVNGSVEWLNITRNTSGRKALYSLSAGMRFL
ncbi:MAG: hypothetical protein LBR90_03165 [Elusimicrobiota bacterium]|jgi:hypothetical protein|nr:hypothetical protein [Elusimicrobiota bacterium]